LLESIVWKRILNSSVPPMPALEMSVLLKVNSFFLFYSLFKKKLIQSRFVNGVLPSPKFPEHESPKNCISYMSLALKFLYL